jgi:hypothetical protein
LFGWLALLLVRVTAPAFHEYLGRRAEEIRRS